jgi:mRNA (guanine-N7-)-methyltransferase
MEKNEFDSDSSDDGFFKTHNEEKPEYKIVPVNNNNIEDNIDETETKKDEKTMINYGLYYKQFVRDPGIEGRKASRLLFLRSFNNWIKSVLINKYTYFLGRDLSILDICCGRGGDLEKFFRSKIRIYVGSDLAEESLKNAMDRLTKLKNEKFKEPEYDCKCIFITEDVSDPNNHLLKKIPQEIYFDLVSCQFAMHYHFENEDRLRAFLTNVTSKLNNGGYFIGTIIDSNVLVKRLRERKTSENKYMDEKLTFGNEFYSVKFSQKRFPKDQVFGIKYGFYLEDSLDKKDEHGDIKYIEEFLVIFDVFLKIAEEYGLYLVENMNFTEYYEKSLKNDHYYRLFKKMIRDLDNPTREKQWEIIQLYQIFVLRKGKPDSKSYKYVPAIKSNKIHIKDYNPVLITQAFE